MHDRIRQKLILLKWGVGEAEGCMTLFRSRDSEVGEVIVAVPKATTKSITFKKVNGKTVTCSFKTLSESCCTGEVADLMNKKSFKHDKTGYKKFIGKSSLITQVFRNDEHHNNFAMMRVCIRRIQIGTKKLILRIEVCIRHIHLKKCTCYHENGDR